MTLELSVKRVPSGAFSEPNTRILQTPRALNQGMPSEKPLPECNWAPAEMKLLSES